MDSLDEEEEFPIAALHSFIHSIRRRSHSSPIPGPAEESAIPTIFPGESMSQLPCFFYSQILKLIVSFRT